MQSAAVAAVGAVSARMAYTCAQPLVGSIDEGTQSVRFTIFDQVLCAIPVASPSGIWNVLVAVPLCEHLNPFQFYFSPTSSLVASLRLYDA